MIDARNYEVNETLRDGVRRLLYSDWAAIIENNVRQVMTERSFAWI